MRTGSYSRIFICLTVFLVGLAILASDFVVRKIYVRIFSRPHGRIAHPFYDHSLRPNSSWMDRYGPYEAAYFSNSLGFRDGRNREVSLSSGKPRLVLIGDSFTEGVGVPWEETFAGLLEKSLAPEGIEVLNAGCNSYTPILARIKLRHWIADRGLRIDRVVLFLDQSDIKDELFYEEDSQGRARLIPYGPFASVSGWGTTVEEWSEISENFLEPNFVVLGAISRNLKLWIRRIARKELGRRGLFTNQSPPQWILEWDQYQGPEQPVIEAGIRKLQKNIGELAAFLRSQGIPLTLVVYPYPFHVLSGNPDPAVPRIWSSWCAEYGIDFIDLFPEFIIPGKEAEVVDRYYLRGDCHWNANGHARVAEALLRQRGKIEPVRLSSPKRGNPGR